MENADIIVDLLVVLTLGFALGLAAHRLRQPVIVGYLVAGVILAPGTFGFDIAYERIELLANLGVTLLMFSLGIQFSFAELLEMRHLVVRVGFVQIGTTLVVAFGLARAAGLTTPTAFLIAEVVSISSSTVAFSLLQSRGALERPHGRVATAVLIAQDLAVVPLLALLPVFSSGSANVVERVVLPVLIAAVAIVLLVVLGSRIVPWVLRRVAIVGSRELFLAAVVAIAFGVAFVSERAGLSLALGAFLAGVVVSESEFGQQVLGEIIPLRDLFSIVFFTSIGLLIDPAAAVEDWRLIVLIIGLIVAVKGTLSAAIVRMAGYPVATAVSAAVLLTQIGEFSFVLASHGIDLGIIDDRTYNAILLAAVVSLVFNGPLTTLAPWLATLLGRLPFHIGPPLPYDVEPGHAESELRGHIVVGGYGRAGHELVRVLERRGFRYIVIDLDPQRVRELRERGVPVIYGDIANEQVLRAAGIAKARVFAITVPDLVSAQAAIRLAKRLNPSIDVIARALSSSQVARLDEAGATEVVQPAFEAGLEFVRHTLRRYGVSLPEIQALISARRLDYYEEERLRESER